MMTSGDKMFCPWTSHVTLLSIYGRGLFSLDGKYSVSELGNHNKFMNTKYQLSPLFCSTMLFPKDASIFIWWSAKGIDQGISSSFPS